MRLVLFTGLLTTTLFLHVTRAEGQAEDQATARALFNDARELMKQERFGEACPSWKPRASSIPEPACS